LRWRRGLRLRLAGCAALSVDDQRVSGFELLAARAPIDALHPADAHAIAPADRTQRVALTRDDADPLSTVQTLEVVEKLVAAAHQHARVTLAHDLDGAERRRRRDIRLEHHPGLQPGVVVERIPGETLGARHAECLSDSAQAVARQRSIEDALSIGIAKRTR